MKLRYFIFSIYIAFVACYPCLDAEESADEMAPLEQTISNHDHSSKDTDLCSPLCICSCCSTQVSPTAYFHFELFNVSYTDHNPGVIPHVVKPVSNSIWQPPKFS